MKKYVVESRRDCTECFDNYVGDYVFAETEVEAVELYKQWLIDNECDPEEVEEFEYQVTEVDQ